MSDSTPPNVVSFIDQKVDRLYTQQIDAQFTSADFDEQADRYGSHREDLWYLRLINRQFNATMRELALKYRESPNLACHWHLRPRMSTPSKPSILSFWVGSERKCAAEVARFTICEQESLYPKGGRPRWDDNRDVPRLATEMLEPNGADILLPDLFLWVGSITSLRTIKSGQCEPSEYPLIDPQDDALSFHTVERRLANSTLCVRAFRRLPQNRELKLTMFYRLKAVRTYLTENP